MLIKISQHVWGDGGDQQDTPLPYKFLVGWLHLLLVFHALLKAATHGLPCALFGFPQTLSA